MVRRRPIGFTLIELLVVLAMMSVLISLLLPAIQQSRETVRRVACATNLAQLGLAIDQYTDAFSFLPPGTIDAAGPIDHRKQGYRMSWMVQLLPLIEERAVYKAINFNLPAESSVNSTATQAMIRIYVCPSNGGYAGCHDSRETPIDTTNNGLLFLNSAIRPREIPDGRTHTLMVGEKMNEEENVAWAIGNRQTLRNVGTRMVDVRLGASANASELTVGGFYSSHGVGGTHFLLADGHVKFVSELIDMKLLQRYADRSDGGMVSEL